MAKLVDAVDSKSAECEFMPVQVRPKAIIVYLMGITEKKGLALYLIKVLTEYSDEDHPLTQNQIIFYIEKDFNATYSRKTISNGIKFLEDLDYDIVKVKSGIFLGERIIEPSQLSFILDGLLSSRSISGNDTLKLSKQLFKCLSKYKRKDYSYIINSNDVNKSDLGIFFNIDQILDAIKNNKMISFNYGIYDLNKKLVPRNNSKIYLASPYYLVNNLSRYYLLCKLNADDKVRIFRVDYLMNIEVLDQKRESMKNVFGDSFQISKYLNEHIYLFDGKAIEAKVELDGELAVNYVVDWFGKNVEISEVDGKYYAKITSNENALFYWCLQYGRHIKVISPKSLVNRIIEENKKNLEKYLV